MFLKSLRFIILTLVCSGLQNLIAQDVHKKCVLFGIQGVLLYPDIHKISGGRLGSKLGFTPEKIEQELIETLQPIAVSNFPIYTQTYPVLIEAWLTGYLSNAQIAETAIHHIKKHCGVMKASRLKQAIKLACSDEQAKTFSTYNDSVALARRCKKAGCTIALSSNWSKESLPSLMKEQNIALGFFDTSYISGYCGMLAATPAFYDAVIKDYGLDNIVLIDCLPENIRAAKTRGIKTISFSSAAQAERELKALGFLS